MSAFEDGPRGHAYDGIEHTQPGPFADCLLCRLETIESAARAYIEHAYPSLLRGVRDPNHPLLSALAKAIPPDGGGAK